MSETELPPGNHTIAGGVDKPEVSKTLRLGAGTRTHFVIDLKSRTTKTTRK